MEGLVVGEILEVNDHPNADKLHVCKVDIGAEENLTIVCGKGILDSLEYDLFGLADSKSSERYRLKLVNYI